MAQSRARWIVSAILLITTLATGLAFGPVRAASTLAQSIAGPDWAHTKAEFPADPDARYGRLANGMRYVIYHNHAKARGASMRFEIASGSLQERDDQRGLAHFVEHMAFRGSANQSDGDLEKTLKREGFTFGSDVNAFTDYETTKYVLDLPSNDDEPIASALFILREIAGNLSFDADAIEHERGVILSEERMRASTSSRSQQAFIDAAYHDRPYALRDAIGTLDTIRAAPRQAIIDYYHDWYRPELAILVVVGDVDTDAMEKNIRARFSDWQPTHPGPVHIVDYGASTVTGLQTAIYTEKNLYEGIGATWFRPYIDRPDTLRSRTNGFLKNLAVTVLNERYSRAAEDSNAAFLSASLNYDNNRLGGNVTALWVVPKPGRHREAFVQALRILNRFKAQGVTAADVADYITTTNAQMDNMVRTGKTRFSDDLAEEILSDINDDNVFETADQYRTDWSRLRPALTPAAVTEQMALIFAGNGPLLSRQGEDPAVFDAAALKSAWLEGQTASDDGPQGNITATVWPYTDFGPLTRPVSEEKVAVLNYHHYRFANGVTANIRYNPLNKNEIIVSVRFAGGYQLFSPSENLSLQPVKIYDIRDGGLGKLSTAQIDKALAARSTSFDFDLSEGAATMTGYTTRDSFATQMQLLMAYTVDPGYRPDSFVAMKASLDGIYQQLHGSPGLTFGFGETAWMSGKDPRYILPDRAAMDAMQPQDIIAIYRRSMTHVPVEITITGDIHEDAALKEIERTFANLPPVPATFTPAPGANTITMPPDQTPPDLTPRVFYHEGRPDQSISAVIFPATDALGNLNTTRGLMVLSEIFSARLDTELRNHLSMAYDGSVGLTASEAMKGFGYIQASGTVAPENDQLFYDTVLKIAADLADHGVKSDELDRARNPLVQYMNDVNKNNEDWQSALQGLYGNDTLWDYRVRQYSAFLAITTDDIQRLAKQYLNPATALRARASPKPATP